MIHLLGGFLVVSVIVIVTPGPDTVLTTRNTVLRGRRGGLMTGLGVGIGQATWTLAASAGARHGHRAFLLVQARAGA